MRAPMTRTRRWLIAVAVGGSPFVLEGCDPNVRQQVLSGVGQAATGLATTFIDAFFQALINDAKEDEPTTVMTLPADLPHIFT